VTRAEAPAGKGGLALLIHCLLAASLVGCGGGHPATRGFDSREVLPLRDSTLNLWTFSEKSGDPLVIYSTVPEGTTALNYWSLDVTTGSVENFGTAQPASLTAVNGPYACSLQSSPAGGPQVLDIYDLRTGAQTDVDQVLSYAACPRSDGVLTVFRADPTTGSPQLWQGPFAQLQQVTLNRVVQSVGQWLFDASGTPSGVLVAAQEPPDPQAFGLYTLDLGTITFTEDVPATPASADWAGGAMPAGSLQSATLATGAAQAIRAIGDHFVYTRTMSDGGTTMFVGPFSDGPTSELALFQVDPKAVSSSTIGFYSTSTSDAPVGSAGSPTLAAWSPSSAGTANTALMVWDDTARTVLACPSSAGATPTGVISPDGSRVLFSDFPSSNGSGTAAVTLLSLAASADGGDSCLTLATAGGTGAGFSADAQAVFWTIASALVDSVLWAAAADGSNPRMIGSGAISLIYAIAPTDALAGSDGSGSERLEFYLDSDFVWVDLRDNPIVLHDVVQQVFEGYYDLGNSRLLIGYDFSTQDGTGTLGLVDRDTGAARPISPSVADFRAAYVKAPADGGATDAAPADAGNQAAYDVVYVVRGRNPSPQDGIWVARLNAADLQ
jgi:hypothetical protein